MGALESALYRPQTGYYLDLLQEAATLLESLAINHPFIDGNKRSAFAVTDVFLKLNGYQALDWTLSRDGCAKSSNRRLFEAPVRSAAHRDVH